MADPLAHIRSGALIKHYPDSNGWVILEDGRKVAPPQSGFIDGNDKIVPVVSETQDTSVTQFKLKTIGQWTVEANRYYRLTTIRDKTVQELDDEKINTAARITQEGAARLLKLVMSAQFTLVNEIRVLKGQGAITVDQYLTHLSTVSTLPDAKFAAKIKELLS